MSDREFVTGPHRVDQPHPDLVKALADLVGRVTVADGATGFTATIEVEALTQWAQSVINDVSARPRLRHLLTLGAAHELVGAAILRPSSVPTRVHTCELEWLLVDPQAQRDGLGATLLEASEAHASALGVTHLELRTRADDDLVRFFTQRGWRDRGRWPGAVQPRAELVWLTREL